MFSRRTKRFGTNFRGKRLPQVCHAPQALVPFAREDSAEEGILAKTGELLGFGRSRLCGLWYAEFKKICLPMQKIFLTSDLKSSTKALVSSKRLPGLSSFCVKSKGSRQRFPGFTWD